MLFIGKHDAGLHGIEPLSVDDNTKPWTWPINFPKFI